MYCASQSVRDSKGFYLQSSSALVQGTSMCVLALYISARRMCTRGSRMPFVNKENLPWLATLHCHHFFHNAIERSLKNSKLVPQMTPAFVGPQARPMFFKLKAGSSQVEPLMGGKSDVIPHYLMRDFCCLLHLRANSVRFSSQHVFCCDHHRFHLPRFISSIAWRFILLGSLWFWR